MDGLQILHLLRRASFSVDHLWFEPMTDQLAGV
jgi:hypothetical protein